MPGGPTNLIRRFIQCRQKYLGHHKALIVLIKCETVGQLLMICFSCCSEMVSKCLRLSVKNILLKLYSKDVCSTPRVICVCNKFLKGVSELGLGAEIEFSQIKVCEIKGRTLSLFEKGFFVCELRKNILKKLSWVKDLE